MKEGYKERTSTDNNTEIKIKYNFNSRFNLSKEKSHQFEAINNISKISILNNSETEKQKEIYKTKIISRIKKYNPNLRIKRQSSFSRFDNEEITRNKKEINQKIKMLSINYIKKKKERNSVKKNYSASNIKDFDCSPFYSNKNKDTYTLGSESTSVTKKKKFQIKPYKSNKIFNLNDKKDPEQNKENISNNIKTKGIPFSSEGNHSNKNKIRTSFQYLIHQAYKNKALSKSFSKFYQSSRSKEKSNELNEKVPRSRIIKMNFNKKANNLIIKSHFNKNKISRNNLTRKYFSTNTGNNTSFFDSSYNNKKENDNFKEDFEILFNILKKMKILLKKIDIYEQISDECYHYIRYYFSNLIYNKLVNFFSDKSISNYIKREIICFLLCYDISFNNNSYNQTGILLKTILSIIYSNYIIILYSFLVKNNSNELEQYLILLQKEIANNQMKYEGPILQILENNFQYINNYYKMIVDNIYKNYNGKIMDKNIKFPNCIINNKKLLENKILKINIISSFFHEAFKSSNENTYSFIELQKFFYFFLCRNNYKGNININNNTNNTMNINSELENKKEFINNSIKNVSISNFNNNENNQRIKYLLPKIKNCYEYSLVLDLDETLISFQKNTSSVILRPGLYSFLHKMKNIYELILFTSATHDYVDPIVNFIEKEEKYFEYILYRKHLSYDEKGECFKNLNLLNRNNKKVIIVDDSEKNFKLHKSNGICIKPFKGESDNVLSLLTQILIMIKINAEKTGDIRICLKQAKKDLIYKNIENKYK